MVHNADELAAFGVLREYRFESRWPVIGPLVARLRGAWHAIAGRSADQAIICQQTAYNQALARHLVEFAQRLAEVDRRMAEQDQRYAGYDERIARFDQRIAAFDQRLGEAHERIAEFDERLVHADRDATALSSTIAELTQQVRGFRRAMEQAQAGRQTPAATTDESR
jgi:chromosome segregation ATPase